MNESGRRLLTGRLARRIFLLFLLSAIVPLGAMALLSFTEVRGILLKQGDTRLAASAKAYGMAVYERLLVAREIALTAATHPRTPLPDDSLVRRTFADLRTLAQEGIAGLHGPAAGHRLAQDQPVVTLTASASGPRVILLVPLAAGKRVAVGELAPEFLWGDADQLPAATDFCILEEDSRTVLHCTAPHALEAVRGVGPEPVRSAAASVRWQSDGEPHRAIAWGQYMRAAWGTTDWIVVATQPESVQLAALNEFRSLYVPVVVLALLLATWFTIRQSRNILDPVAKLAARARGITRNDFATRLDMRRDDEFGELAGAFDHMSARLGRQFATLTALSEIDRLILSAPDAAEVIRLVLERMGEVVPADALGVALFDVEHPDRARTFVCGPGGRSGLAIARLEADPRDRKMLEANPDGAWLTNDDVRPGFAAPLYERGVRTVYIQPIAWHGTVCGALAMGYAETPPTDGEERQQAREFADRLAVAVSSAWRDEQLYIQAHYDALTGLPNRLLFRDRLEREMVRCGREGGRLSVLFIDLDNFKSVNDSFGHTAGDVVLHESARRIAGCLRGSDTVARIGGDEFVVLLTRIQRPQDASRVADQVGLALSREFSFSGNQAFLSASIGIATYPGDGVTAEQLLGNADMAMYRAKGSGRRTVVYFEDRMNAEMLTRHQLDRDLRRAIERGEFELHYQPLYDLASGEIRAAEALLRWNHPEQGLIPPGRFVPVAEETGVIEQIGQFVIEEATRQAGEWRRAGLPLDQVAVNMSPRQFRKPGLVDFVRGCITAAGIPASMLELEITEGMLVDRVQAADEVLGELAALGVGIALDDFGTGFSSMAYLTRFPVHTIKVDRVFVQGLGCGRDAEAIVTAIIAMSKALGKRVVAEGVETAEQLAILRRLGCERVQGFHFSAALPAADFAQFVSSRSGRGQATTTAQGAAG